MKTILFLVLALLLGLGAVLLYRVPVQRYVVACERTTATPPVVCILERARTTGTQRWQVPLGPDARAVVRIMPRRRGYGRVLLYLESAASKAVFAAEFEGAGAAVEAEAAAAQLNRTLSAAGPAVGRIEVSPPPIFRWAAWSALGVMGLLVLAGYRHTRLPARAA
jgi:hypothetical protein